MFEDCVKDESREKSSLTIAISLLPVPAGGLVGNVRASGVRLELGVLTCLLSPPRPPRTSAHTPSHSTQWRAISAEPRRLEYSSLGRGIYFIDVPYY
eukprot:scaffold300832_cov32-Tisochrysis_lutea.AAC.1